MELWNYEIAEMGNWQGAFTECVAKEMRHLAASGTKEMRHLAASGTKEMRHLAASG